MEKPWIIRLECDFCFEDQDVNLYQVDMKGDHPMSYVACANCCRKKGWSGNE